MKSEVDPMTRRKLQGKNYDQDTLTTVLPRLEGEDRYTVMAHFRQMGIPGYRNGVRVPCTDDDDRKPQGPF